MCESSFNFKETKRRIFTKFEKQNFEPYHGGKKRSVSRVEYGSHSDHNRGKEEGLADLPRHLPSQEVELHRAGVHQRVEALQNQTIRYVLYKQSAKSD